MEKTSDFENLTLSSEEATRLKDAFQNKKFLKLFQEYAENVNSIESKKLYEEEIIALERERGHDVKFIHPDPLNQYVREASFERKTSGTECQIPVILSKPREDFDNKGSKCTVVDVMFHPKTIELSNQNSRFKHAVEDTALSTVQKEFKFEIPGQANYPKLKYKGTPPSLILRNNKKGFVCEPVKEYWEKLLAEKEADNSLEPIKKTNSTQLPLKIPTHFVKYRDTLDMKDFSLSGYTDTVAPKAIIVEVKLPEVESAIGIELDIFERKLVLKSKKSSKHNYYLNLDLSYAVDKNLSTAQFEKSLKMLCVTLPVKDRGIPKKYATKEDEI